MTEDNSVVIFTTAIAHNLEFPYEAPTLLVSCDSGLDEPDIGFIPGGEYIVDREDRPDVGIRFDDYPALKQLWFSKSQTAKTPFPLEFINRATQASLVYIQLTTTTGQKITAEFKLNGLAEAMAPHRDLCFKNRPSVDEVNFQVGKGVNFRTWSNDYEPMYVVGIPTLRLHCRQSGEKSFFVDIEYAGHFFNEDLNVKHITLVESTIEFHDQLPKPLPLEHFGLGTHKLVPLTADILDWLGNSESVVVRGQLETGQVFRASFDTSQAGQFLSSHPFCQS